MPAPYTEIVKPDISAPNAPEFDDLATALQQTLTWVNLTFFDWEAGSGLLKRIWSSHPVEYPVGGSKKMQPTAPWPQAVLYDKRSYLCKDEADLRSTFNDFQTIIDLGGRSLLTFPITENGVVLGAVNLTGGRGAYDESRVETTGDLEKTALAALKKYKQRTSS